MVAPYEKFIDKKNDIIQIVVTTTCDLYTCSNCTQLLPFRKDYRHMTLACFEKALTSLVDWPGVVALFGGNPCSHPAFDDLCALMREHIHPQSRRGLWSNNLLGHGSIVRRTFYPDGRFNLNVHRHVDAALEMTQWVPGKMIQKSVRTAAEHAPILMHYRDLGITPSEWIAARESCDINQHWSAAIVERNGKPYAYFCEVAAALDGIRGENHGVPLYHQWWQAPMQQFQHQVGACCDQGCGVPLRFKGRRDSDDTYDHTASFVPLLVLKQKPPVTLTAWAQEPEHCPDTTDYMQTRS